MNRQKFDQLEDETIDVALTEGLKALAATTESQSAPAHLESSLLVAFRRQLEAAPSPSPVRLPVKERPWRLFPVWTYATAAAALIVTGYAVSVWRSANAAPQDFLAEANIARITRPIPDWLTLAATSDKPSFTRANNRRPLQLADDGSSVQSSFSELTPLPGEEIATDFMPLTYESDSQPMESGQLIRVQVPRTALASFGLPVNFERANETIKADLLLAEDGSARAIRFIR